VRAAAAGGGSEPLAPQHAALNLWALAALGLPDDALCGACCRSLAACGAGELSAEHAARALWAAATLGVGDARAVEALAAAALRGAPALTSAKDAADAVWGAASLDLHARLPPAALQPLVAALERAAPALPRECAEGVLLAACGGFPVGEGAAAAARRLLCDSPPPSPPAELVALRVSVASSLRALGAASAEVAVGVLDLEGLRLGVTDREGLRLGLLVRLGVGAAGHSASSDSKRSARRPKGWVAGPDARPTPPPLTPRAKTGAPSAPKAPHNQMAQRTAQNNRVDEARGSAADGRGGGNDRPAAAHTMPPNKMGRNGNDGGGTILWRCDGCGHEIKLPPP